MVATDVFGRGIDIERVNIVINYDMPDGADTYLHRVGRAGRFGTKGLAVTFVSSSEDSEILNKVQERFEVNITEMPDKIDISTYSTPTTPSFPNRVSSDLVITTYQLNKLWPSSMIQSIYCFFSFTTTRHVFC